MGPGGRVSMPPWSAGQYLLVALFAVATGLVAKSPTAGIGLVFLVGAAVRRHAPDPLGAVELTWRPFRGWSSSTG